MHYLMQMLSTYPSFKENIHKSIEGDMEKCQVEVRRAICTISDTMHMLSSSLQFVIFMTMGLSSQPSLNFHQMN
jgi:hypothetical protein